MPLVRDTTHNFNFHSSPLKEHSKNTQKTLTSLVERTFAILLLQGESAYNSSLVGWGGHQPGGGVKAGVKEVLDTVRINTPEEVSKNTYGQMYCRKGGLVNWAVVH